MDDKVIPNYDHYNMTHKYIYDCLSYKITNEDFEEIERILANRKEDHEEIDKTTRMLTPFGGQRDMYQPRIIPEFMKEKAHKYVDWSSAQDIWMILSKYADFYSKYNPA